MSAIQTLLKTLLQNPSSIASKSQAKQLHAQIIKINGGNSTFLTSIVLSIYANLNLYHESLILFNTLHRPPALAWKSIIRCYTSNGLFHQSLAAFVGMRASGEYPDHNVFPSVIKSSTHLMDLRFGESVHGCAIHLGMDIDLYTGNALMNMYSKLWGLERNGGLFSVAAEVLDKNPKSRKTENCRSGFVDSNKFIGNKMGSEVDSDGNMLYLGRISGREVLCGESFSSDSYELINEFEKPVASGKMSYKAPQTNKNMEVLDHSSGMSEAMSMRMGERRVLYMDSVRKVFEMMPKRDLVSWNTMIAGNAQNGRYDDALTMVMEMGNANLQPDSFTLSSLLPIFAEYVDVVKGKVIHGYAIRHGFDTDLFIGSSLIDMMRAKWSV
ncbi:hypothetical protein U1Q18_015687 [Sarracenia purpurea var. burkii]